MGILWTILVGLVVGAIARFIMPGEQKMGWILTILLGIGGSFAGNYIAPMIGITGSITRFALSTACAVGLLFLYEMIRKQSAKK